MATKKTAGEKRKKKVAVEAKRLEDERLAAAEKVAHEKRVRDE